MPRKGPTRKKTAKTVSRKKTVARGARTTTTPAPQPQPQPEAQSAAPEPAAQPVPPAPAPDPVFDNLMASMGEQPPDNLDPAAPSNAELQQLEAEARRGEQQEAIRTSLEERSRLFPQAPKRGGGVREGIVDVEAAQEVLDPRFPDMMDRFFQPPPPIQKRSPEERVFQSRWVNHYVQVTCPAQEYDPIYGKRVDRKGVFFQFEPTADGQFSEFRTTDPFIITFIEGGRVERRNERTGNLETVTVPPMKGYGTIVWDAEERQKAEARMFVGNLQRMLTSRPQVLEALRQTTDAEDFGILERLGGRTQQPAPG